MATGGRKHWSKRVIETSNALDLDEGFFAKEDPRSIALSLKRTADRSRRRLAKNHVAQQPPRIGDFAAPVEHFLIVVLRGPFVRHDRAHLTRDDFAVFRRGVEARAREWNERQALTRNDDHCGGL